MMTFIFIVCAIQGTVFGRIAWEEYKAGSRRGCAISIVLMGCLWECALIALEHLQK